MLLTDDLYETVDLPAEDVRARLLQQLAGRILMALPADGDHSSIVSGLTFFRRDGFCGPAAGLLEPGLSLVIRGRKRVAVGTAVFDYGAGLFALTSVELPAISQVLGNDDDYPFLSASLQLSPSIIMEVCRDIDDHGLVVGGPGSGMAVAPAGTELLMAIVRLAALAHKPQDIPVMAPLLQREVIYRLLCGPAGSQLRNIAIEGTTSHRIAAVVSWLRINHAATVRIEDLAKMAAMAVSTFHFHFKAVTHMSPLQYQKQIRLHEARRLLVNEAIDAAEAAYRVGYESVTQFSREYRRQFGDAPIRDTRRMRGR